MRKLNCASRACILILAILTTAAGQASKDVTKVHGLTLPASKDTTVRFFFQPLDGRYFHIPLLFRVVNKSDPRRNTAPMLDVGRTAYVSLSEMQQIVARLAQLPLQWDESAKIQKLETYEDLDLVPRMRIDILSVDGTAKSSIDPDNICKTLSQLDDALQTPRALWEFQLFRMGYDCRVPNFNPDAYSSVSDSAVNQDPATGLVAIGHELTHVVQQRNDTFTFQNISEMQ